MKIFSYSLLHLEKELFYKFVLVLFLFLVNLLNLCVGAINQSQLKKLINLNKLTKGQGAPKELNKLPKTKGGAKTQNEIDAKLKIAKDTLNK